MHMQCGCPSPDVTTSLLQESTHSHAITQHTHHTLDSVQEQGLLDTIISLGTLSGAEFPGPLQALSSLSPRNREGEQKS